MNCCTMKFTALLATCLALASGVAHAEYPYSSYPTTNSYAPLPSAVNKLRTPSSYNRVATNPAYERYLGNSTARLPLPLPGRMSVSRPQAPLTGYSPTNGLISSHNQPLPPQLPVPDGYTPIEDSEASPSDLPARDVQIEQLDQHGEIVGGYGSEYGEGEYGACGEIGHCCRRPRFYGSIMGLYLNRDRANQYTFSYDSAYEQNQYNDHRDAAMDFSGGVEARVGYIFGGGCGGCDPCGGCGCGAWGLELGYWGIYPGAEENIVYAYDVVGDLNAILNFDQLDIGGVNAGDWTYASDAQRVRRTFDIQNVELNLLRFNFGCGGCDPCCPQRFSFNWGVGARYFRFNELLGFSAMQAGYGPYFDNGYGQLNYDIDVKNELWGGQLTGQGRYCITPRLSALVGAKFGLFANSITHRSVIYANNQVAVINNGPNAGQAFDIATSKTDASMMAELNLGLSFQLTKHIGLVGGYRILGISGLALPSNQIYSDLRGIQDVAVTDSNGSMILHGAYLGLEFVF